MKKILSYITLAAIFYTFPSVAQSTDRCIKCSMVIKDHLHKASASEKNTLHLFDSIECLINYIQTVDTDNISEKKVVDYTSGEYINADTAYYIKSKAIPSPMGANISACKYKEDALKLKSIHGGEVYNWKEIKEIFENSDIEELFLSHHDHNRPDAHAPIGMMGDHLHHRNGLMISLRHMNMTMNGNMKGSSKINDEKIYEDFMVAPQHMNMQMYMMGLMYAPSDHITLTAMQNYITNNMGLTSQMMMGGMKMENDFKTKSKGFGDLTLGALFGIINDHKKSIHLNSFISLPVGSVEERDNTPMNDDVKLPYRMQLGSGTMDYGLGATFKRDFTRSTLGMQILGTVRTGKNSEGYRLGNQLQMNVWGAYALNNNFSITGRLQGITEGKIVGNDKELKPTVITTANTANYGCKGLRSFLGINANFSQGAVLNRFTLGAEIGTPIYENYTGIQMNENVHFTFGLKYNIL